MQTYKIFTYGKACTINTYPKECFEAFHLTPGVFRVQFVWGFDIMILDQDWTGPRD